MVSAHHLGGETGTPDGENNGGECCNLQPEDFIAESIGMKVAAVQDVVVEFFEHSWLAQHHASQKQAPCFEQVWHLGLLHNPRACRQGDKCQQKCEREAVVPEGRSCDAGTDPSPVEAIPPCCVKDHRDDQQGGQGLTGDPILEKVAE